MSDKIIQFSGKETVDSGIDSSEEDKAGKVFKFMSPVELAAAKEKREAEELRQRKIAWILKQAEQLDF